MKKVLIPVILILILILAGTITVQYYTYLFSKTVSGEILNVERVNQQQMIISGGQQVPANQLFSFAVSIKDPSGEIHTASSEDRQWAVAKTGQCVEAKYFPYPPWSLDKTGTYHSARLTRLFECEKK